MESTLDESYKILPNYNYSLDDYNLNILKNKLFDSGRKSAFFNRKYNLEKHYVKYFNKGISVNGIKNKLLQIDAYNYENNGGDSIAETMSEPDTVGSMEQTPVQLNEFDFYEKLTIDKEFSMKEKYKMESDVEDEWETDEEKDNKTIELQNVLCTPIPVETVQDGIIPKNELIGISNEKENETIRKEYEKLLKNDNSIVMIKTLDNEVNKIDELKKEDIGNLSIDSVNLKNHIGKIEQKLISEDEKHQDYFVAGGRQLSTGDEKWDLAESHKKEEQESNKPLLVKRKRSLPEGRILIIEKNEDLNKLKRRDRNCITHISDDKQFWITGTKRGYIHIYSFLNNNTSGKDEEDTAKRLIDETSCLREVCWESLYKKPKISFKAHDKDIFSIQIIPKSLEGRMFYLLTTTSFDKTAKIFLIPQWRLSDSGISVTNQRGGRVRLVGFVKSQNYYLDAVCIPNNKSNELLVFKNTGELTKYEIDFDNLLTNKNIVGSSTKKVSGNDENSKKEEKNWCIGRISKSCNYYCIGSNSGNLKIYDVKTLNLISTIFCRNTKGIHGGGKPITGVEFNKKEDRILITTMDSNIRLISKIPGNTNGLWQYVEKFKGTKNVKKGFKAKFCGYGEHFVICPSENNNVIIWQITYNKSMEPSSLKEDSSEKCNQEMEVIKNEEGFVFKVNKKYLIGSVNMYNVYESYKLENYQISEGQRAQKVEESDKSHRCLALCRSSPEKPDLIDHRNNLVLVSSQNGVELKYAKIYTGFFQS